MASAPPSWRRGWTRRNLAALPTLLGALATAAGSAHAEPAIGSPQIRPVAVSGTDLVFRMRQGDLVITRGKVHAPLPLELAYPDEILGVEVRTDEATVTTLVDTNCQGRRTVSFTRAALEARIENAAAMTLKGQKQWSAATAGFARALKLDPALREAATNLAAAQVRAGEADAAVATLVAAGARDPVWVVWRLAVDPDLASVASAPALTSLRPRKPAHSVLAEMPKTNVAYSPERRLVAWEHEVENEMSDRTFSALWIADATTGLVSARLSDDGGRRDRAAIDATLGALGFDTAGVVSSEVEDNGDNGDAPRTRLPKTGLTVVFKRETVRLLRGRKTVGQGRFTAVPNDTDHHSKGLWAARLPGAVLVGADVNIGDGCGAWVYNDVLWIHLAD
jgi:hypothetical protein